MRINAPHIKTESLPSSIPASAPWLRSLSPPVLRLALLCVLLCWHISLRDVQALFSAPGYVQVLGPRRQSLRRGETSAIAVLGWNGVVRGSGADTPVVLRTRRLLLLFLHPPPPPSSHAISRLNSPQPPRPLLSPDPYLMAKQHATGCRDSNLCDTKLNILAVVTSKRGLNAPVIMPVYTQKQCVFTYRERRSSFKQS